MTLTEFLLTRLEEDYEIAYGAAHSPWKVGEWDGMFDGPREILDRLGDVTARCYYGGTTGHVVHFDPTRVLRMIEATRKIVEGMQPYGEFDDLYAREVLELLALTYRDHEDYRTEMPL